MNIKQRFEGDKLVLFLDGNFDESTSASVESVFQDALTKDCRHIFFDMGKVKYISSAGIRVLIVAYKKAVKTGKKVGLVNMSEKVLEIIETVGILPMFSV